VISLLSGKEGAEKIGESVRKSDLEWIWYPMENATPPSPDQYEGYLKLFKKLQAILDSSGFIYLHSSAGIHRTGMIVFALLLYLGFSELEAQIVLLKLRKITYENVGVERFEWGRELLKYKENQDLFP
jgi:protein-tyrosine phosphatase